MSFSTYARDITLPVTETRVLIMTKQPDSPRSVHVRHLGKSGETGPATLKFQESQDNSTWDDISGTAQIVTTGTGTSWLITSTKPYVALSGYGNVDIEVKVIRSDPDTSLPQTATV